MNKKEILNDLAPCGLSCRKCFAFKQGNIGKHSLALKGYLSAPDCDGCRKGTCKWPDCEVQACFREKGVDFCFECDEFPCDKTNFDEHLKKRWIQMQERLKEIGIAAYYEENRDQPRYR